MRTPKGFNPGHLNIRVRLVRRKVEAGEGGFQSAEYSDIGAEDGAQIIRYAEWNDDGARSVGYAEADTMATTQQGARLTMRHVAGVDNTCRIVRVSDGSQWAIVNVKNYFGGGMYMELAVRRLAEGGEGSSD